MHPPVIQTQIPCGNDKQKEQGFYQDRGTALQGEVKRGDLRRGLLSET
jgi:hypothetical protein